MAGVRAEIVAASKCSPGHKWRTDQPSRSYSFHAERCGMTVDGFGRAFVQERFDGNLSGKPSRKVTELAHQLSDSRRKSDPGRDPDRKMADQCLPNVPAKPVVQTTAGSPTRSISARPRTSFSKLNDVAPSPVPSPAPRSLPTKPEVPAKKPEILKKPEVVSNAPRINSKEVIEKHKNWSCHFSTQRKAVSPEKKPAAVVATAPVALERRVVSTLHFPVPSFAERTVAKQDATEPEAVRKEWDLSKSNSVGMLICQTNGERTYSESSEELGDSRIEKCSSDPQLLEAVNTVALERFQMVSRSSPGSSEKLREDFNRSLPFKNSTDELPVQIPRSSSSPREPSPEHTTNLQGICLPRENSDDGTSATNFFDDSLVQSMQSCSSSLSASSSTASIMYKATTENVTKDRGDLPSRSSPEAPSICKPRAEVSPHKKVESDAVFREDSFNKIADHSSTPKNRESPIQKLLESSPEPTRSVEGSPDMRFLEAVTPPRSRTISPTSRIRENSPSPVVDSLSKTEKLTTDPEHLKIERAKQEDVDGGSLLRSTPVTPRVSPVIEDYDVTVKSAMELCNEPTVIELSSLEPERGETKPSDSEDFSGIDVSPGEIIESVFDDSPVQNHTNKDSIRLPKAPIAPAEEDFGDFDDEIPEPLLKELPPIPQDEIGVDPMTDDEQHQFLSQQFDSFNSDSNDESWPPEEAEIHWCDNGGFFVEVEGLISTEEATAEEDEAIPVKSPIKLRFSTGPIRVYAAFSVSEYDRKNDTLDPLGAQAEYELEKRIEKMDVFPVEFFKGAEGLGISIIGMGVGADGGVEKLGIFVKSITKGGAADKDGKIQVNDQIIEVDGRSLVGVTQAYAASVLRNTKGLVKFMIARDKEGENGEVATLIRQSVEADRLAREREMAETKDDFSFQERRLAAEGASAEPHVDTNLDNGDVVSASPSPLAEDDNALKTPVVHLDDKDPEEKLKQLQKKYWRAKRVLKEREREWTKVVKQQHDDYWHMINYLSEQMTKLTSALGDVEKTTGLQLRLPSPSDISPIIEETRAKSEQDPMLAPLDELDLSDLETLPSDVDDEEAIEKAKKELDEAVPKTTLLDVSAARQKADLAARALVSRVLPSLQALKMNLESQYGGFDGGRMWPHNQVDPRYHQHPVPDKARNPQYWNVPAASRSIHGRAPASRQTLVPPIASQGSAWSPIPSPPNCGPVCPGWQLEGPAFDGWRVRDRPHQQASKLRRDHIRSSGEQVPVEFRQLPRVVAPQHHAPRPTYPPPNQSSFRGVPAGRADHNYDETLSSVSAEMESGKEQLAHVPQQMYAGDQTAIQPNPLAPLRDTRSGLLPSGTFEGPPSRTGSLQRYQKAPEQSYGVQTLPHSGHQQRFTQQFVGAAPVHVSADNVANYQWPRHPHIPNVTSATHVPLMPHSNLEAELLRRTDEFRASANRGPMQQLRMEPSYESRSATHSPTAAESPENESSQSHSGPPSQTQQRYPTVWQPGFVMEWSKEQVSQWLLAIGLDNLKSLFLENGINGNVLFAMNSDYMRSIGISSEDRARLKKRVKELKVREEKQRKILEKEFRNRDKVLKKAEKDRTEKVSRRPKFQ
ncbi:unnamed protein product [Notodromas monacha]|uniref:Neurabin-1 n=1 Tax=Notodromas monacha TaxID=399045 RepID=A0A7R9BLC0_9CRUS|nr:unnamed protein product [Notodromas monacha]CAG0916805.1 unnamed protein product [Notodromas monacha]